MSNIKIKKPQKETPNESQGRDGFQTPNYAVDLLVPFLNKKWSVWECASGQGKIVKRLQHHGFYVFGTDLLSNPPVNFLTDESPERFDFIGTNPPFSIKKKFYEKCLQYGVPFALLIPFDMNQWICEAFDKYGCQALVPNRRINYITPAGKSGKESSAQFHSFWLTYKLNLPNQLTIVDLTKSEVKTNI